jgi:hypothetical protein
LNLLQDLQGQHKQQKKTLYGVYWLLVTQKNVVVCCVVMMNEKWEREELKKKTKLFGVFNKGKKLYKKIYIMKK